MEDWEKNLRVYNPRRFFDRTSPVAWFFVIAFAVLIVISFLQIQLFESLAVIAMTVIGIYIVYLIIWFFFPGLR